MSSSQEIALAALAALLAHPSHWGPASGGPETKALYLSADNGNAGYAASLAEALLSGRPFAINLRPEVIPIDLDTPEEASHRDQLCLLLDAHGLPYVECASGGDLHNRHFFAWVDDDVERLDLLGELRDLLGGKAVRYGQRMRPPGAPHRTGTGRSMPCRWDEARTFLHRFLDPPETLWSRLQPSTRQIINEARVKGWRNQWDLKVIWRLVLDGLNDAEILRLAFWNKPFSERARERLEERGQREALYTLLRPISLVRKNVWGVERRFRTREDVDDWLLRAKEAVQACSSVELTLDSAGKPTMSGRRAATLRRILESCLDLFLEQHTIERPIAVRTLEIAAGVSFKTAKRYLELASQVSSRADVFRRELTTTLDWLIRVSESDGADAAVYRINFAKWNPLLQSMGGREPKSGIPEAKSSDVAFRWGFLNESGRTVVNAMADGAEWRRQDLVETTQLPSGTVDGALKRLVKEGVVDRVRHGVYQLVDTSYEELGELLGADLVAKRQLSRIEGERISFGRHRLDWLLPYERRAEFEARDSRSAWNLATGEVVLLDDWTGGAAT